MKSVIKILSFLIVIIMVSGLLSTVYAETQCVFYLLSDNTLIGFSAEGHSGYAEKGYDIVCAAISALTYAGLIGLYDVVNVPLAYTMDDGLTKVMIDENAEKYKLEEAQIVLKTLLLSLQSVQQDYPNYIDVKIEVLRD